MKIKKTYTKLAIFISVIFVGSMAILSAGKRDSYSKEQLTVLKTERLKDNSVRISYAAMAESVFFSPGVSTKASPQGTEVVIIRQGFRDKKKAPHPAKLVKKDGKFLRVVTIPSQGEAVLLKYGKKAVEILPKVGK